MKVCIATEFYPASAISSIVKELVRQGMEVVVFTSQHDLFGRKRSQHKVETSAETVYFTPSIYLHSIPYAIVPFVMQDFVKVVRQEKVDVVHAQMFAFYTIPNVTPLIKQICKVPLVLTFHGLQHEAFVNPFYRIGMAAYYRSYFRFITHEAEVVITLSKLSKEKAIRLGANPNKVLVLPNGVNLRHFYPSVEPHPIINKKEKIRVVYVGRVSASKGVFVLLQAAIKLTEKYGDQISFLFAGDGPDRAALQDAVEREKLTNVTLLGHVHNVRELLVNSDIFVLPSFYEGLPVSLMEAMACAVPVVTSRVGDVLDLVKHAYNGVLVPPRDVDSLILAIEELVENSDFRKNLAKNGYETIKKNYNIEKIAKQLRGIYENLLNKRETQADESLFSRNVYGVNDSQAVLNELPR